MSKYIFIFVLPLLACVSCLHSRTTGPGGAASKSVMINFGSATLKINGQINENLYAFKGYDHKLKTENYYDNPVIPKGTISKNEIQYLSTGEKYIFSVLPTEVVTINITSLDGNDVEISVFDKGKEKKYSLKGTDKLGLFVMFQNR